MGIALYTPRLRVYTDHYCRAEVVEWYMSAVKRSMCTISIMHRALVIHLRTHCIHYSVEEGGVHFDVYRTMGQ